MKYKKEEVLQYVAQEDVKFIRMAFCDAAGKQKNISVMPPELDRAFTEGIALDGSAIAGFGTAEHSDLFLRPDPATISVLPWRPEHGRVVRMFCNIFHPDGAAAPCDTRAVLIDAVQKAKEAGITFNFGAEMEFYLFRRDEDGIPTQIPHDTAGYMDIAPQDLGENVRREICLTLEQMGICPESSHHEEGPGQNEIDFRYAEALKAADDAVTFRSVVSTVAARNGLAADFSPKPIASAPGSGMHINISVKTDKDHAALTEHAMAGILAHIAELTAFLNPHGDSYRRFGTKKAPLCVSWAHQNRTALIRIPAASGEYARFELRSPDSCCNPYLAYALLIYAALDGIRAKTPLPAPCEFDLYTAAKAGDGMPPLLPQTLDDAKKIARQSAFLQSVLCRQLIDFYTL